MAASTHQHRKAPYRCFLESKSPFLEDIEHQDAATHTDFAMERLPLIRGLPAMWLKLLQEPFKGITTDGRIRRNLFRKADDGISTEAIKIAGDEIMASLTGKQREAAVMPLGATERRMWQNTHLYFFRLGLRLDEIGEQVRSNVLKLLQVAMSPEGYRKAILATETNAFLGELYNGQRVLNRYSYNFVLFGEPSLSKPWGWTFFGHHLCLSFLIYGNHIEISPTFMGAEPNVIDDGLLAGTDLYIPEQDLGLGLMRALPPKLQQVAHLRGTMDPPNDTKGMHTWALCGAFQDNRVILPEGLSLSAVTSEYKASLLKVIEHFVIYLPRAARERRLKEMAGFMNETWFCWIGGFGDEDPFYYRIQSPVIICEFEHCPSIFLGDTKPERFHIHTHVRTPNGGDYGHALLE